ncbi:MAG TPA: hypothetical protein VK864_08050 [Longimicrobiales bacterium]|nr:hypothetical protein [Longimicrobiales bacterium]
MRIFTLVASFIVAGCATTAATTIGFPAADADDDDLLTSAEFNEFWDDSDLYERFDDNDDGNLTRQEYNEAVEDGYETEAHFKGLDSNNNGMLDRSEFINGWFNMFDADKNSRLTRAEFENAVDALEPEL